MNDDFSGCVRSCRKNQEHSLRYGLCAKALPPPCAHPADSICWDSDGSGIVCGECRKPVSIRDLAEEAHVSMAMGCTCSYDLCTGMCNAGRPLSWNLDPRKILRILDLEER